MQDTNPLIIVGKSVQKGLSKGLALPIGATSAIVPAMISKDKYQKLAGIVMAIAMITAPIWVTTIFIVDIFKSKASNKESTL